MTIAVACLLDDVEALRQTDGQVVFGPRHRDVEKAGLLLQLMCAAGAEVGRDAAIDGVQDKHRPPFLPLGGVDRGQDQIILFL